jgi:hypothetical protein
VGGYTLMHREDLRRVAPLWLKYTEDVRFDPDVRPLRTLRRAAPACLLLCLRGGETGELWGVRAGLRQQQQAAGG